MVVIHRAGSTPALGTKKENQIQINIAMKHQEQETRLSPVDSLSCISAGVKLGLLLSKKFDKPVNDPEKTNGETEEKSERT